MESGDDVPDRGYVRGNVGAARIEARSWEVGEDLGRAMGGGGEGRKGV